MPTRYNIAIQPGEEISEHAIEASNHLAKLAKGSTYFILDGKNFFPHISIYYAEFPEENLPKIIQALERLAKEISPFQAPFLGYGDYTDYIAATIERTPPLQELQDRVIDVIDPLRGGIIRDKYLTPEYQATLEESQKQNILQKGYPSVGQDWDPHLTLARLGDLELARKLSAALVWAIPILEVNKLGVYTMGANGTCVMLLESISLES